MRKLKHSRRPIVLDGSFRIIFIALMGFIVWREVSRDFSKREDAFS